MLLCGGAINSPQLLMLSGIGPGNHLAEHGIDARVDLPGVGGNLQDHPVVPLLWYTRGTTDLAQLNNLRNFARWKARGTGPLASNVGEAGAFFASRDGLAAPDIQIHAAPSGFYDNGLHEPTSRMFTAAPDPGLGAPAAARSGCARPTRRGTRPSTRRTSTTRPTSTRCSPAPAAPCEMCTQGALARYLDRPWQPARRPLGRRPRRAHPDLGADALPPDLDLRDGLRRGRRRRPGAAGPRGRRPARRRRLGDAGRDARQHQRPHHHDRREGGRPDPIDEELPMTQTEDRTAPGATGPTTFDSLNPATGDVVGTHPVHTEDDVRAAVERAREAAAWWSALSYDERDGTCSTRGRA